MLTVVNRYAECGHPDCRFAECRGVDSADSVLSSFDYWFLPFGFCSGIHFCWRNFSYWTNIVENKWYRNWYSGCKLIKCIFFHLHWTNKVTYYRNLSILKTWSVLTTEQGRQCQKQTQIRDYKTSLNFYAILNWLSVIHTKHSGPLK
jgi:hypothetical protein